MAVVLKKSVFLHISKTGGTWATKALNNARMVVRNDNVKHYNKDEFLLINPKEKDKVFFAFVRNPVTWWQSRWSCNFNRRFFTQGMDVHASAVKDMVAHNCFRNHKEFNDFNFWINRVLNESPSDWLTSHYKHYLGDKYDEVTYIGKYENLTNDLIGILNKIGEKSRPRLIRQTPYANESNKNLDRSWNYDTLERAIESSYDFMTEFGYSTSVADYSKLCNKASSLFLMKDGGKS